MSFILMMVIWIVIFAICGSVWNKIAKAAAAAEKQRKHDATMKTRQFYKNNPFLKVPADHPEWNPNITYKD